MPDDTPTAAADMVMMTVELAGSDASLEKAAAQLGVPADSLDTSFGLVPVDPDRGLYTVKVPSRLVQGGARRSSRTFSGPFSNPRIAPFGFGRPKSDTD